MFKMEGLWGDYYKLKIVVVRFVKNSGRRYRSVCLGVLMGREKALIYYVMYTTLLCSLIAIVASVYTLFLSYESEPVYEKYNLVAKKYLAAVDVGDKIGVTGFLYKNGKLYELHESEVSPSLSRPNGFAYLTLIHPESDILASCNNTWVNVIGTMYLTGWGESLDSIDSIYSLSSDESCTLSGKPLGKRYMEALLGEGH